MSNNNNFWGRRYGFTNDKGNWLNVRSFGGSSRTGVRSRNKNGLQSRRDKAKYIAKVLLEGFKVIEYDWKGRVITI